MENTQENLEKQQEFVEYCPEHNVKVEKLSDMPLIMENFDYLYKFKCPCPDCKFTTFKKIRKRGFWFF